jgi:peptidoglycan/xylan/chitin deacetylase (PgdA/CDA1 family)
MKNNLIFMAIIFISLSFISIATLSNNSSNEIARIKREKYLACMKACQGIKNVHAQQKVVAVTFDDGPSLYTNEVLNVLKENNIKATFFVIGTNVEEYPDIVKKIYDYGNVVGTHTYSHHYLPNLSDDNIETELIKNNILIGKIIGNTPKLFRPPYGSCSDQSRMIAQNLGLITILWNAVTDDYNHKNTTPTKIAFEIVSLVQPGTIICLHDGGGDRRKTVEALKIIILVLKNEGYEFLTVSDLLNIPAYL